MKGSKIRRRAIANGYRSGLEDKVALELETAKVRYEYETMKIDYVQPAQPRKYTPDFILLDNSIIVETKGRFTTEDRKKHLWIKKQHPNLDIRFVFSSSKSKLYKGSKTTYADWCNKHGFLYADKSIPEEWINE